MVYQDCQQKRKHHYTAIAIALNAKDIINVLLHHVATLVVLIAYRQNIEIKLSQ